VRGHNGHPGNELADQLANKGVEEFLNIPEMNWHSVQVPLSEDRPINPYKHLMSRVETEMIDRLLEANKSSL
jgi:methionyl-tRNA synthetase